jgi:hypothetical protein
MRGVMIMRDRLGLGLDKKWERSAPNGFRRKIRNQDARARVCCVVIFDISTMTESYIQYLQHHVQ